MRGRGERGAATLLVLTMSGVVLLFGAALAVVTAMVVDHRMAETAADLAALAGARGEALGGSGCAAAARVAAADHARLTACEVIGRAVEVEVEVAGPHWLGQQADLAARSRAGPAP